MIQKSNRIVWSPFSEKHKAYIKRAANSKMSVAEGSIRSGKTIDHCIIAARYLEKCRDKIHLASGSTIGNAKLNIGACNGYGLENLFRGRCKWGKYLDNDALFVYTQTGEKIILFAGGGKADSYKKILGNSYGLWIATEINEHYDSDDSRTSFIKVAFGRQVAAIDPFVLWDLNPCNPGHKIYSNYIDAYQKNNIPGYNYEHFTINDNLSISEERKEEIKSRYVVGTAWYRRDILGERCIAEGLIYPMYEDALKTPPEGKPEQVGLSIDYGTQNAFAALLWGKYDGVWYLMREYYYSGRDTGIQKTDEEYADELDSFLLDLTQPKEEGEEPMVTTYNKIKTVIDPSAASFIALLKKRGKYRVVPADNAVQDGIRETATCMKNGRIKINPECKNTVRELQGYVWDEKADEDKPVKVADHCCDSLRYWVKTNRLAKVQREYVSPIFGKVYA